MRHKACTKKELWILESSSPTDFISQYNTFVEENKDTILDETKTYSNGKYVAMFTLRKTIEEPSVRTVADEFHDEGIRYVCSQCPFLENTHDGRRKRYNCKYAEFGTSRIDSECCDYFYRLVKTGKAQVIS